MHTHCHRCGGELSPADASTNFCPHCGAPQLYLPDYDRDAPTAAAVSATSPEQAHPQRIDWQVALRCAALVSAVAGLLSILGLRFPAFSIIGFCWTISASMTTLVLYQRQRPTALMDTRIGARIGLTTGLLLAVSITLASTIAGVVARYALHSMSSTDTQISQMIQQAGEQVSHSAGANPELPAALGFMASSEFRAGIILFVVAVESAVLLFLSTLGGAVGGLLRTRRSAAS